MKIAIVFDKILKNGGGVNSAYEAFYKLFSNENSISFISVFPGENLCNEETITVYKRNVNVEIRQAKEAGRSAIYIGANLVRYFCAISYAKCNMNSLLDSFDIVISSSPSASIFIPKGVSFIQEIHASYDYFYKKFGVGKIEGFLATKPSMYLMRTRTDVNQMKQLTSIDCEYIDMYVEKPAKTIDITRDRKHKICFVGRLTKVKNIPLLLDIAERLKKENVDATIDVYGKGDLDNYLQKQIDDRKLNNMKYCGYLNDNDILQNYSLLLLTSTVEGFPIVTIEARQYGVIPLSSNWGECVSDVINNGIDGYICNNVDEYVKTIKHCFSSDLKQMRANCLKSMERFDAAQVTEEWNHIFQLFKSIKQRNK